MLLPNEFSEANLNAYKRILNWQPFMKRVYGCIGLFIKHYTKMRTRLPKVGRENVKAAPFSNKRFFKLVPSLPEWYIKGIRGWTSGVASPY